MTLEQARQELRKLRATPLWAWAFGHGCSLSDHPEFQRVRARDEELLAIIKEHTA